MCHIPGTDTDIYKTTYKQSFTDTVQRKYCSLNLESLFLNSSKSFHSVWEFSSFILVSVYSPPHASVNDKLRILVDQLMRLEQKLMDSLFIILGDFNRAKLNHVLPKYRQHNNCPTGDENHSHSYTSLKDAYHSVHFAAFGHSDYCLVNHIPMYMRS